MCCNTDCWVGGNFSGSFVPFRKILYLTSFIFWSDVVGIKTTNEHLDHFDGCVAQISNSKHIQQARVFFECLPCQFFTQATELADCITAC